MKVVCEPRDAGGLDYLFRDGQYATPDRTDQPVVVLMDLKLPRLGGLESSGGFEKTNEPGASVVILTTSTEHEDLMRAGDLHANSYVRKPVDFDRFVDAPRASWDCTGPCSMSR